MNPLARVLTLSLALLSAAAPLALAVEPLPAPTTAPVPDLPRVPPTPPEKAEATFRCLGGFRMQLIAAEPLVTDPVAMCYDEDGRAYVAEMNDYPYTNAKTHQAWKENTTDAPIGKIRLLVDTDGDGVFDKSTVFVEHLSWPTGVACYKGGVFVCATPDVWYFKDTDGDGVADVKRKVFTGFRKFNVQAVMNNLEWGLDNCLYGAGGSNGGTVSSPGHPDTKPLTLSRNDFRFDPANEKIELIPGGARFGNTFDDWGNRFVCNIRNPAQHVVVETRYLMRNPYVPVASVVQDVAKSGDALPVYRISPLEAWRDLRANRLVSEKSKQPRSELVAGGVVTSASGVTIYRGDAYPPEFRGQIFLGEVANNLIHRQIMEPAGVTFTSKRVDDHIEFVASTDVWFRPVNFVNAPDGTLHVLDMYREVIEHPWSIPDDIKAKLDLRSGADRGRIYRLAPPGFKTPKPPKLSTASTAELIACLENRNSWWRETAQRLLVERQDKSAIGPLRERLGRSREPLARPHALWTLDGLAATTAEDVERGLKDESAGVRENAIRVAERHLEAMPRLVDTLMALANDADARVRFQALMTSGGARDARVGTALADALRSERNHDTWLMTAAMSGVVGHVTEVLEQLGPDPARLETPAMRQAVRQLCTIAGAREQTSGAAKLIGTPAAPLAVRLEAGVGLGEGLRTRRTTIDAVLQGPAMDRLFGAAMRTAADAAAPADVRTAAIRLIGFQSFARANGPLASLLDSKQPPEIQRAAVATLRGINAPEVAPLLLSRWRAYTPALRADVLAAVLAYKNRLPALLDAIEAGRLPAADIPASTRATLVGHADAKIKERAVKLFGAAATPSARKEVLVRYAPSLQLPGDAAAGRKVFEANCVACHRVGDLGADVGPNLATVRQWSPEQLLTNILDPNREVAPAFTQYVVQMTDGESLSGVVAEETGTSLALKLSGGTTRVLSRRDVKRVAGSPLSLMPENLEAGMTPQQMADLIAFLRSEPAKSPTR
jgi:putative membrane-bound dehydrogenase-like protein